MKEIKELLEKKNRFNIYELENSFDEDFVSSDASFDDTLSRVEYFFNRTLSSSSVNDGLNYDCFETKRLIVKAKRLNDFRGAIDCVSGYNDLYILQYDSQLSAKRAYEYYLNSPSVEYVEPDTIYYSQEDLDYVVATRYVELENEYAQRQKIGKDTAKEISYMVMDAFELSPEEWEAFLERATKSNLFDQIRSEQFPKQKK